MPDPSRHEKRLEFAKYLNTVLITIGLVVSVILIDKVNEVGANQLKIERDFTEAVRKLELEFVKANQVLIGHLEDSDMWIDVIQDLAEQVHPATKSRYTQLDAVKDRDRDRKEMEEFIEKTYKRKNE